MVEMDQDKVWQTLLGEIEVGMSPAKFQTWFSNTSILELDVEKGLVVVQVPNEFTKGYLQKNFQKEIHRGLTKLLDHVSVVQYVVGPQEDIDRRSRGQALIEAGLQCAELEADGGLVENHAVQEHPLADEIRDEAAGGLVVQPVRRIPLIDAPPAS